MPELNKWNETERETISEADRLAFLKEFADVATVDIMMSQILAEKKWATWVLSELKRNDLTRAERLYFRKQQVNLNMSNQIIDDAIEAQRELAETKQEIAEAKQNMITIVINLLKKDLLSEEEIAEITDVDIKRVQEIKAQLNDYQSPSPIST